MLLLTSFFCGGDGRGDDNSFGEFYYFFYRCAHVSDQRFAGKTISVSLFAAAILFSAPGVECSIYSTCKRISQKLLRNVKKFLDLVYLGMDTHPYKIIRSNCEELVIQGPEGKQDQRVVNSYPSKVSASPVAGISRERPCYRCRCETASTRRPSTQRCA